VATYIQVVNDDNGKVLMSKSVNHKDNKSKEKPMVLCHKAGVELAADIKKAKVEAIVFDRNGYKYHGKIKAVAEGLREGGIKF
jgi:large subunit ribosomal protein L18